METRASPQPPTGAGKRSRMTDAPRGGAAPGPAGLSKAAGRGRAQARVALIAMVARGPSDLRIAVGARGVGRRISRQNHTGRAAIVIMAQTERPAHRHAPTRAEPRERVVIAAVRAIMVPPRAVADDQSMGSRVSVSLHADMVQRRGVMANRVMGVRVRDVRDLVPVPDPDPVPGHGSGKADASTCCDVNGMRLEVRLRSPQPALITRRLRCRPFAASVSSIGAETSAASDTAGR